MSGIVGIRLDHRAASYVLLKGAPKNSISAYFGYACTRIAHGVDILLFLDTLNETASLPDVIVIGV